ncbi:PAS domain S-box protein [Altererythrobacter luteolus]|uniref:histidine kinase n=1 Tax=Pontixanthobacter luteolus TaxID=295089 RepID=A0A6I4V3K0_9SPHN|nr:GAF domain-containing protein [Pontixanthobacter luteolus]MXP47656.1 PAS domain S-box protein [Pontixanthobacter luteolus]
MKTDYLKPWPAGEPPAPAMCGEETRISVLAAYGLDALEDDPELSEITNYVSRLCDAPVALVSLVESERQRFLARAGLEERETPRPTSFCAHAMLEPEPMIVSDALEDDRFEANPLVVGHPHIRFYAGAPLISHEGAPLGSLCVIDTKPRPEGLTDLQKDGLQVFAAAVMRRLRHRRENLEQTAKIAESEERLRTLIDSLPHIAFSITSGGKFDYVNARFGEIVGAGDPKTADDWRAVIHEDDHEPLFTDWYKAFSAEQPYEGQFRLKHNDGTWRWAVSHVIPVRSKTGISWFGTVTDIDDAHRAADARELLTNELTHRIKNIFAVIGGLVTLKKKEHDDTGSFAADLSATLQTLGRAHSYATQEQDAQQDTLHGLIGKLLAPYGDRSGQRLSLNGDDVPVRSRSATPLALVFHELATNCAKYGSFSETNGRVRITTDVEDGRITIRWEEHDGPPVVKAETEGFGSRLVEATVSGQLNGSLSREFTPDGLVATLNIAVDSI